MTVNHITPNQERTAVESVRCQWFAGKKLEVGTFPIKSVEILAPKIP
ncbi:YodC family protein [Pseudomonas syringae]|nr:YodC family protein [Pseudomonas syringae]